MAGRKPEVALERYIRTEYTLDFKEFSRYCAYNADELFKEIYKGSAYTELELKELQKNRATYAVTGLKEVYGVDYKIIVRVTGTNEFDEPMFSNSIAGILSTFDYLEYDINKIIDVSKISAMIEYEYEVVIAGSRGEITHTGAMLMAKVGKKWGALPNMF